MAANTPDAPEIVTLAAAAQKLGIARRTLLAAHARGELPAFVPGEQATWKYVRWQDCLDWLQSRIVTSKQDKP